MFFFVLAIIGASEGSFARGEGYLALALLGGAVGYGLYRRDHRAWPAAVALAVANAGLGFAAIPQETLQLVYAGLFVANTCILIWIKSDFIRRDPIPATAEEE